MGIRGNGKWGIYFRIVLSVGILSSLTRISAQTNIDSLKSVLAKMSIQSEDYITTLSHLADYYAYRGNDIARTYIRKLEQHAISTESRIAQNHVYAYMGLLMNRQSKSDSSKYYYNLELKNWGSDSVEIARVYQSLGAPYYRSAQYDSMAMLVTRSIAIAERHDPNNKIHFANCYNALGIANEMMENHELSVEFYNKSLQIKKELNDKTGMANTHANLSISYSKLNNIDQSVFHDTESLKLGYEVENDDIISNALHSLGVSYKKRKEYDKSESHLRQALEIRTKTNNIWAKSYTLYVLGNLYQEMGNQLESLSFYDQGIASCEEINNRYTLCNILINKSKSLIGLDRVDDANSAIKRALEYSIELDIVSSTLKAYKVKSEVENLLGNHETALSNYKSYHVLSDSLNSRRLNRDIQDLQLKYATKEKEAVIIEQNLLIEKSKNQRNLLTYGLMTLALLSFLVFSRFKQNQLWQREKITSLKRQQKLLAIDSMLVGQQEERKRIAQDLHDGLGGLLTSAKLQMQRINQEIKKLENLSIFQSTEKLIDNACNEVRRIAHDMMPDALVNLNISNALEDLAMQTQLTGKLNVTLEFSDPEIHLNEKASLMIYRIAQEAMNNTLKYAEAENFAIKLFEQDQKLILILEDNGKGFDPKVMTDGKGIKNIKSRVEYLEGELEITSSKPGVRYYIQFPKSLAV